MKRQTYLSPLLSSSSMECCIEILGLGTGMAEADVDDEDTDDDECVEGESCGGKQTFCVTY